MRNPRQVAIAHSMFRVGKNTTTAIPNTGARTALTNYDVINENPGGYFDPVSGRFIAREAGLYQFNGEMTSDLLTADNYLGASLLKNGVALTQGDVIFQRGAATSPVAGVVVAVRLVPGDYVQMAGQSNQATNGYVNNFSGFRVA